MILHWIEKQKLKNIVYSFTYDLAISAMLEVHQTDSNKIGKVETKMCHERNFNCAGFEPGLSGQRNKPGHYRLKNNNHNNRYLTRLILSEFLTPEIKYLTPPARVAPRNRRTLQTSVSTSKTKL